MDGTVLQGTPLAAGISAAYLGDSEGGNSLLQVVQ
jgi:hypothetical protein